MFVDIQSKRERSLHFLYRYNRNRILKVKLLSQQKINKCHNSQQQCLVLIEVIIYLCNILFNLFAYPISFVLNWKIMAKFDGRRSFYLYDFVICYRNVKVLYIMCYYYYYILWWCSIFSISYEQQICVCVCVLAARVCCKFDFINLIHLHNSSNSMVESWEYMI